MGSKLSRERPSASPASDEVRAILNDLRLLVRELRISARDAEKGLGISGAQLFVLQCLEGAGVLSMGELAERTHTDQSSVSVVVSRLSDARLVTRAPSPSDARRIEVRLSAKGRSLVRVAPEATQVRLGQALVAMSPASRTRLRRGLSELASQMNLAGAPRMFFEDEAVVSRRAKRSRTKDE